MDIGIGDFVSFLFFGVHANFSFVYADVEKTLVSWVMVQDRNIKAGSILTLQEGTKFDGIVFAEKMDDKWINEREMERPHSPTIRSQSKRNPQKAK